MSALKTADTGALLPDWKKSLEVDGCRVGVRANGVMDYVYPPKSRIDLAYAKSVVAGAATLIDAPCPGLIHINDVVEVSRDARVFFAESPENQEVSTRVALLGVSPLARVFGNFFMGFNKRGLPTRLFSDEQRAIDWLLASD